MPKRVTEHETDRSQCDDCQEVWHEDDLHEIRDFWSRVEAGGIVPSGECPAPNCGALCYPTKKAITRRMARCGPCNGTGKKPGVDPHSWGARCPACDGIGKVIPYRALPVKKKKD